MSQEKEILQVAKGLEVGDKERRLFVAVADFVQRELLLQLKNAWPEVLRIAEQIGDNEEAASVVKIPINLKVDLTDMDILSAELKMDVTPWKLTMQARAEENLNQFQLDFEQGLYAYNEDEMELKKEEGYEFAGEHEPHEEHDGDDDGVVPFAQTK